MDMSQLFEELEKNPSDTKAFDSYHSECIANGDREGLERVYDLVFSNIEERTQLEQLLRRVEMRIRTVSDEALQHFMYVTVGKVYWQKLGKIDKAEMLFRKVGLEEGEFRAFLVDFYKGFYADKENWRRLEQLLMETGEDTSTPEGEAEVKRYLARLALEKGKKDKAIAFWQGVRALEPEDEEAEQQLKQLYVDVKKWTSLVELLNQKLDRLADVEDKIALHLEMVEIFRTHIRSDAKVNNAYQAILELQPDNRMALDALVEQFTAQKRWPDLVRVLQQKVAHTEDRDELIALHREIARIMQDRFSNAAEAIKAYDAILELEPQDREALTTLKQIYESRHDWERYVEISLKEISFIEDPVERHEATVALAALASDKIRRPATAIDLWSRVLEHDPQNSEALKHLQGLYEREKNFEALVDVLEKTLAITDEKQEQIEILHKLAKVYGVRLNDDQRTVETWTRVLALNPEDRQAQTDLRKRFLRSGNWKELEWFFRSFGTVEEFVRTIDSQIDGITDEALRVELLFKAASIWQNEIDRADHTQRALRCLENILKIDEHHLPAAKMLLPIYRELEHWDRLPFIYEIELQHNEEPDERKALYRELARIHEEQLGDVDAAFFTFVAAFRENIDDQALHAELERLAEQSENWETYVAVLEETLARVDDPTTRILYRLRAATVQATKLGDDELALASYLRVLDDDPAHRGALEATIELYRRLERWTELVAALERKLALEETPEARKEVMFALGRAWRDFICDSDRAVAVYREMLEQFPEDIRVLEELGEIYLEQGDYGAFREILEWRLSLMQRSAAPPSEIADVLCDLGMLTYAAETLDGDLAPVVACYEQALAQDPDSERAIQLLEELLAAPAARAAVCGALEPVYRARQVWDKLADVLEIRLALLAEAGAPMEEQVPLLAKLGPLYRDELDAPEPAFRSYSRIFKLDPSDPTVRPQLEALAERMDRFTDLVALYEREVDRIEVPATQQEVLLTVAHIHHQRLTDLEAALGYYERVLTLEPTHWESLDALEEIYGRLRRYEQLLEVYDRKIDMVRDDTTRVLQLIFAKSALWRDELGDLDQAIATTQEVLEIDPDNVPALERLDSLYEETEQFDDLAETLRRQIELAHDDHAKVALRVRLAETQEHRLGDVEGAINNYAAIIQVAPENEPALAALERLFADSDWSHLIAPILEPHYERQGDWQRLIAVYEVQEANAKDDTEERVRLHFRMSDLYRAYGDDQANAFKHYSEAFRLDPDREETLRELLALAELLHSYDSVVTLIEERIEDVGDPLRQRELYRTAAELSRDRMADSERAKRHFRAVIESDPEDKATLDALAELYRGEHEWRELIEILLQKATVESDQDTAKLLYHEASELAERELGDAAKAIEIYESLRNLDPTDSAPLDPLENLYGQVGDWAALVEIYTEKISRATDIVEKKRIAGDKATVQEDRQEAPEDAIETYRQILEWDPEDLEALRKLDRLYQRKEDWHALLGVLQSQLPLVTEEERPELYYRIGRLYETEIEDVTQAVESYRLVLEAQPRHPQTLQALEAIVRERDERALAFDVLRPVLSDEEDWGRLLELYEVIVQHEPDEYEQIALYRTMADIAEERMADPTRAFEFYGRALCLDVEHSQAIPALERLAEQHDLFADLVPLYRTGAAETQSPDVQLSLQLKIGAFLKDRLIDLDEAVKHYYELLEDHPDNLEILRALDELNTTREDWGRLNEILRREIELHEQPEERVALSFRLASVLEEKLGDARQGLQCYLEILTLERGNEEAIANLERLYETPALRLEIAEQLESIYVERNAHDDLLRLLERKLDVLEDELDQLELLRRMADLNLETLGREDAAVSWLCRAFVLDPEDEGMLTQLFELVERTEQWRELVEALLETAARVSLEERKIELLHHAARIFGTRLDERQRAEEIYLQILEIAGDNLEALEALDRGYTELERWDDLEGVLRREIEAQEFEEERAKLLVRLAEIYRDRLERVDDAVQAYRGVLDLIEGHRPSLQALAEIYEAGGRFEELYRTKEALAGVSESDEERIAHLKHMAALAETELGKPEEAMKLWEEVLTIAPTNLDAVRELQRLMQAASDWAGFVETCERELQMLDDDPQRRIELQRTVGRTWQEKLEDAFQAQEAWQKVLDAEPEDREALEALRGLYRENESFEQLADVLEKFVALEICEGEELAVVWRELGEIKTTVLLNPQEAITAWQHVLELTDDDLQAITNLERLYYEEGMWEPCVSMIRRRLKHLEEPADKVEALMRAAGIEQENLGDPVAAARSFEQVLEIDPTNFDACTTLERIYEEQGHFERLGELLTHKVDHMDDEADQVLTLHDLARLYEEKLESVEGAFLVLRQALQIAPTDSHALAEIERVAGLGGLWPDLQEVYEEVIPRFDDESLAIDQLCKSARLLQDRLGRPADAITTFLRVLEHDPEHEQALRSLAALYEAEEQWSSMIEVLERLVVVIFDVQEQVAIQKMIGATFETRLSDLESAIAAYQRVLGFEENEPEALQALERLYEQGEQWEDLVDILRRQAVPGDDREAALRLRIGDIFEVHLQDAEEAIETYEEILNIDPANSEALARLEALYSEREDWHKLTEVYERLLNVTTTDEDRARLYKNTALIYEEVFKDLDQAAESYQQILNVDPSNEDALESIERIFRAQERWDDLIGVFTRRMDVAPTDHDKAEWLCAAASIYSAELEDVDQAISTYERVLELDPTHRVAYAALEGLYRSTELPENLVRLLERKAENTPSKHDVFDIYSEIGDVLYEDLKDVDGAIAAYERAFALDPSAVSVPLGLRLVTVLKSQERWPAAIEILHEIRARAADAETEANAYAALGVIYLQHIEAMVEATDAFDRALRLVPNHRRARRGLASIYSREGQPARALPHLDVLIEETTPDEPDDEKIALYREAAEAASAVLEPAEALPYFERVHEAAPDDVPTLMGLARLCRASDKLDRAHQLYLQAIDIAETRLDSAELQELYTALGELALQRGQTEDALDFFDKVLLHDPLNRDAIESLVRIHETREDWEEVIRYKGELRNATDSSLERLNLQIEIGEIYQDRLDDVDGATAAYREALVIAPGSKAATLKLLKVFLTAQRFHEAIDVLEQLIEVEENPAQKASYCHTVAMIYRDQLDDEEKAAEHLDRALDLDPGRTEAFALIDQIMTRRRDWKAQERYYRKMIMRIRGEGHSELEFQLYRNLGEIYRSRMRDLPKATDAFLVASQLKPDDVKIREILAELYRLEGEQEKAVEQHRALLEHIPERIDSYRAIKQLSLDMRNIDLAWTATGVLVLLNQATEEERQFYAQHGPTSLAGVRYSLDAGAWEQGVLAAESDTYVGRIFQTVYQGISANMEGKSLKDLGLKRRNEIKPNRDLLFFNVLQNVSRLLGVAVPRVFLSERATGVRIEGTVPPILLVGPDALHGKSEAQISFELGKLLTYFHPMNVLAGMYPPAMLQLLLKCAVKFVRNEDVLPEEGQETAHIVREMKRRMSQQLHMQLSRAVNRFLDQLDSLEDFDLDEWLCRLELTANHAGLLCCSDVEIAGRVMSSDSLTFTRLTSREKIKDLVLYAVSTRYDFLREAAGLKIT